MFAVSSNLSRSYSHGFLLFVRSRSKYHQSTSLSLFRLFSSKSPSNQENCSSSSSSSSRPRSYVPNFTIFYNDVYEVQLPPNHRFPMAKYGQVRRRVENYVNKKKAQQLPVDCSFQISPLATVSELKTTHCPAYVQRYLQGQMTAAEQRNVGFPWSPAGVNRTLSSVGGTVAAARTVLLQKAKQQKSSSSSSSSGMAWAAHVAGGTHHAFYDYGEGFCVFSDIAVAANVVLQEFADHECNRILILDLDVHQGNGNAVLFQKNRPDVFTFSMHCAGNYFSPKEQSDLDIELPVDTRDETYLITLQHWLSRIQKEAGKFDLVFFQAGVDGLQQDRLGRLALTAQGLQRRNAMVYEFCWQQNLPLVITMGGGYPRTQDWEPILAAHTNVYTQAFDFLAEKGAKAVTTEDAETPEEMDAVGGANAAHA